MRAPSGTRDLQRFIRSAHEHGVGADYVREVRQEGFTNLSAGEISDLRDHGVNPDYLKAIKAAGPNLSIEEIDSLYDHGVKPDYYKSIVAVDSKLSIEQIDNLYDHGVKPDYYKSMAATAPELSIEQIDSLYDHGVEPDSYKGFAAVGSKLSIEEINSLRDHGVRAGVLRKMKSIAPNLSIEEIDSLFDHGVKLGLVGFGHGPARFQVRGNEGEGEIRRGLDVHLGKTAADGKAAAIEQEIVIGVRAAGNDGQPAQHGHVNVRIPALHVFPVGKIQAFGFERIAQFHEGIGAAHFLKGDDVGIQRADAFADLGPGPGGFRLRTRFGRLVQIIFDVVSGNAKCRGLKAVEKKREYNNCREPAKDQFQIHQMVIIPASAQVKGQLWLECKL